MNLWLKIKSLEGKTLYTTRDKKPFQVIVVSDNKCVIKVESTGKDRPIPKHEFERAVELGPISSLNTSMIRNRGASNANPTYVLSILRTIFAE